VYESVIGRAGAPAPPFRTQPEAGSLPRRASIHRIRSGSSWLGPDWGAGRSRIDRLSRHRVARVANPDSGAPDPTPPQPQCLPHSDLPASPPSCYSGPFINRLSGLALRPAGLAAGLLPGRSGLDRPSSVFALPTPQDARGSLRASARDPAWLRTPPPGGMGKRSHAGSER